MEIVSINNILRQISEKKLGMYASAELGNDRYYKKQFIDDMINGVGEEKVLNLLRYDTSSNQENCKRLAKEWNTRIGYKAKSKKLARSIHEAKVYYDMLEQKPIAHIKDKHKGKMLTALLREVRRFFEIEEDMGILFDFFIRRTSLVSRTISPQDFMILKQRIKNDTPNRVTSTMPHSNPRDVSMTG